MDSSEEKQQSTLKVPTVLKESTVQGISASHWLSPAQSQLQATHPTGSKGDIQSPIMLNDLHWSLVLTVVRFCLVVFNFPI